MRSASSIVVSRNLSCFSSRARFFLYLAKGLPFASTHGDARSKSCMIAETANLTAGVGGGEGGGAATKTPPRGLREREEKQKDFFFFLGTEEKLALVNS